MKLIKPYFQIDDICGESILHQLRIKANTCYKPEKLSPKSDLEFMQDLVHVKKHTSVLRHAQASCRIICSRSTSHQLVRHGLAHFLQESQRYCNYSKKNNGHVQFILPFYLQDIFDEGVYTARSSLDLKGNKGAWIWFNAMIQSEYNYHNLIAEGWKPERARDTLVNDTKTELVITANLEEWRHIFKARADSHADESTQYLMVPMLRQFKKLIPVVFDDILVLNEF